MGEEFNKENVLSAIESQFNRHDVDYGTATYIILNYIYKKIKNMDDKSKDNHKASEEIIFKNFVILDKKEFGRKVLDGGVSFKHIIIVNTSCGFISGLQMVYNMQIDRFVKILNDPELYIAKYIGEEEEETE